MFRHVVMFKWADDVDDAHVDAVATALGALPGLIPEIAAYRQGRDAGVSDGNFDYAVVGDFASVDDYLVYRDHPQHQEVISSLIAGRIAARAAVQYAFDD